MTEGNFRGVRNFTHQIGCFFLVTFRSRSSVWCLNCLLSRTRTLGCVSPVADVAAGARLHQLIERVAHHLVHSIVRHQTRVKHAVVNGIGYELIMFTNKASSHNCEITSSDLNYTSVVAHIYMSDHGVLSLSCWEKWDGFDLTGATNNLNESWCQGNRPKANLILNKDILSPGLTHRVVVCLYACASISESQRSEVRKKLCSAWTHVSAQDVSATGERSLGIAHQFAALSESCLFIWVALGYFKRLTTESRQRMWRGSVSTLHSWVQQKESLWQPSDHFTRYRTAWQRSALQVITRTFEGCPDLALPMSCRCLGFCICDGCRNPQGFHLHPLYRPPCHHCSFRRCHTTWKMDSWKWISFGDGLAIINFLPCGCGFTFCMCVRLSWTLLLRTKQQRTIFVHHRTCRATNWLHSQAFVVFWHVDLHSVSAIPADLQSEVRVHSHLQTGPERPIKSPSCKPK